MYICTYSLKIFVERCKLDVCNLVFQIELSTCETLYLKVCSNVIYAFLLKLRACYLIQP